MAVLLVLRGCVVIELVLPLPAEEEERDSVFFSMTHILKGINCRKKKPPLSRRLTYFLFVISLRWHYPDQVFQVFSQITSLVVNTLGKREIMFQVYHLKFCAMAGLINKSLGLFVLWNSGKWWM